MGRKIPLFSFFLNNGLFGASTFKGQKSGFLQKKSAQKKVASTADTEKFSPGHRRPVLSIVPDSSGVGLLCPPMSPPDDCDNPSKSAVQKGIHFLVFHGFWTIYLVASIARSPAYNQKIPLEKLYIPPWSARGSEKKSKNPPGTPEKNKGPNLVLYSRRERVKLSFEISTSISWVFWKNNCR